MSENGNNELNGAGADVLPARQDGSPAGMLIFSFIVLAVSGGLLWDWWQPWSAADDSVRWLFVYAGLYLIPVALSISVLAFREVVRRRRYNGRAEWFQAEHPADVTKESPSGARELLLGVCIALTGLALVVDGIWPWSGAVFVVPALPIAIGLMLIAAAVGVNFRLQRRLHPRRRDVS